jgi:hypothetical protein
MANAGGSRPASVDATEEDDFDLNTEEIPTEDDQTPAVSTMEQDDESVDAETEDEDIPDDVSLIFLNWFPSKE